MSDTFDTTANVPTTGEQVPPPASWPSPVTLLVHWLAERDERYRDEERTQWVMSPYLDAEVVAPEADLRGRGYHYLVRDNMVLGGFAAVLEPVDRAYDRLVRSGPLRRMRLGFRRQGNFERVATFVEQPDGTWLVDVVQDPELARSAKALLESVSLYQLRRGVTPDEGDLFLEALLETLANSSYWDLATDD